MTMFSDTPIFQHDSKCCKYIGTWYGHDCYTCRDTLIVRYGNEKSEYSSSGCVGWNPYHPLSKMGGLGEGRTRVEVEIEGIEGYGSDLGKAQISALAFLGRQYLDQQK